MTPDPPPGVGTGYFGNLRISFHKFDETSDDHRHFYGGARVLSENGADRNTASGLAWKVLPEDVSRDVNYPVEFELARVFCLSGRLMTIKVFIKRSAADIVAKLVAEGGILDGVASDVEITATGGIGAYQEEEISFTPTEDGVIPIFARVHTTASITDFAVYDDLSRLQS